MSESEADTCRKYVTPNLKAAGWTDDQLREQRTFTDGRIIPTGHGIARRAGKRADYILYYTRDFPLAVVEAKPSDAKPGDGLQQAMDYAEVLDLKFAYSTNGKGIVEHDFLTGKESHLRSFPSPAELWRRYGGQDGITESAAKPLLEPCRPTGRREPRYYQQIAINRVIRAVTKGQKRVLLTMATGTGKTFVAFQIVWKLWESKWSRKGEARHPRVLYLSDRNILVDKPMRDEFSVFEEARLKIQGEAVKSRYIYFALYQAMAKDDRRPGLFKEFARDFFDLVIVDECHRGSANDDSSWREILEYFEPAVQLGMTATPLRADNQDTYRYFGNPVYTYSLKQGIEDGFLAPYRVHRIVPSVDATGWRPEPGQTDRDGQVIPDEVYYTPDFETRLSLLPRTRAIAKNLMDFLRSTDPMGKTIVFCVDQDHAEQMRMEINNAAGDLARDHPNYVVRITAEEGDIGKGHLWNFTDPEQKTPVVVTTSRLLSTGVDVPTCRVIAIARRVESMTEFKQIIGRGTRVHDDSGKLFFTILDYTGSATRLFADPDFDGEPALITQEEIDAEGKMTRRTHEQAPDVRSDEWGGDTRRAESPVVESPARDTRKFYVDQGQVEIVANMVYDLDPDGHRLHARSYGDYTREQVVGMFPQAGDLKSKWSHADERAAILEVLRQRGVNLDELAEVTGLRDADPFDLLCHVAFSLPTRTRRERAEALRRNRPDFFARYSADARSILDAILEKYVDHGTAEFQLPDVLKVPPLSERGNPSEIAFLFGGAEKLASAIQAMQTFLYAPPS